MVQARSPSSALQLEVEARRGVFMSVVEEWLTQASSVTAAGHVLAVNGQAQIVVRDSYGELTPAFCVAGGYPHQSPTLLNTLTPKCKRFIKMGAIISCKKNGSKIISVPPLEEKEIEYTVCNESDIPEEGLGSVILSDPSSDYAYKVKFYTNQAIGGNVLKKRALVDFKNKSTVLLGYTCTTTSPARSCKQHYTRRIMNEITSLKH
ncbi:hypothetical protein FHG87_009124 [Trinorchestia longiramus]|nr:hypothetical protein FHG87_009124 [Trinorchestia longiramus]